jgi:hypothetical protein
MAQTAFPYQHQMGEGLAKKMAAQTASKDGAESGACNAL